MSFRWIVIAAVVFAGFAVRAADRAPNIVLILIDDMGYADIAPFGSKINKTPHLQRLADEGMKLTTFYAAPVCSPSRSSIMTGCYPKRVGFPAVIFPGSAIGLSAKERTLPQILKERGYATECIGKWHLGDQPDFLPTRRGFDHYFGIPYSNDMGGPGGAAQPAPSTKPRSDELHDFDGRIGPRPPLPLVRDERVERTLSPKDQDEITRLYTEEATKFLHEHREGSPFFLYLAHTAVHLPHHPGDAFKGSSGVNVYNDWVNEVDWSVGQVMDSIRQLKLSDNTLVFFTSDNGGTKHAVNAPLRGFKASTWEGGMREPTIAWWPGYIPAGGSCDATTSEMDLLPTFAKLAGGAVPTDRKIDGHDIWPILAGKSKDTPWDVFYYFRGNALEAVRHAQWKLRIADKQPQLFDLAKDVGESTDVSKDHPDVVKQLQAYAEATKDDLGVAGVGPGCRKPDRVKDPRYMTMNAK